MPQEATPNALDSFVEVFPDDISINNLCDCGRHKCHHKPIQQHQRSPFPKTDYMATFQAIQHPKPRSSKRPSLPAREPFLAPMYLSTIHRDDFKAHGHVERVRPITNINKYEPPKQPLDAVTFYSQEFTSKQEHLKPVKRHIDRPDLIHYEPAKFDGTTINRDHFKKWVSQPRLTYGELPSFTGSLLFPDKENMPLSTMKQSYTGTYTPSAALAKAIPDSIKLEGDHVFDTTHNVTYKKIEGGLRVLPVVHNNNASLRRNEQFVGLTQSQHDFPGYGGKQPCPPKPISPPLPMIDLKFDNKQSFTTENRATFQGHDVTKHPVTNSCRNGDDGYQLPSVKFETETSQKRDYQPIDLAFLEKACRKIPATNAQISADIHFDGRTMNNEFFQNWRVQPRIRYGDFHENRVYFQPRDPFNAQSVAKSSFVPQPMDPDKIFHAGQSSISKDGKMNFETEYQGEFKKKQVRLCRAQVYLMQQELKRRKAEEQQVTQIDNKCCHLPTRLTL